MPWRCGWATPFPRAAASTTPIPRRNFIDAEIFVAMDAGRVASAGLASDQEFVRRIYLDLTGRLPSSSDVRDFLASASDTRRDDLIESLLYSQEFGDYWSYWLSELVENTASSSNVNRQVWGRNAFYTWIRVAIAQEKSIKDFAWECIIGLGNNYDYETAPVNFVVGAVTPMGPSQDTYDTMLAKTAGRFLGLAHYDCLLCHNGRRHLDDISVWGAGVTRTQAQQMAAYFSRMRISGRTQTAPACQATASCQGDTYYQSYDVRNAASGSYDLNTTYGNRPNRVASGTTRTLTPAYRLGGGTYNGMGWRDSFAANMVGDPMFARNFVNRVWQHFFNMGLVDPVDTLDPARLDPDNPPPAPWALQATHPRLLVTLAQDFVDQGFQLKTLIRTIVRSSAYQLSARYPGEWKYDYIPLFARHYARRMEGEEVHDAIAKATGVPGSYTVGGFGAPVAWAMELPEPLEPRSNSAVLAFMNSFYRGNRDQVKRSQSGSILQQLYLMNDAFVSTRVKVSASPKLKEVSQMANNRDVADELFLTFLSRYPSDAERAAAVARLAAATTAAARNTAIEDLAWVLINKVEFLFSY